MASSERIRLARLSYVIYEHPSLEKFKTFAEDFGFVDTGLESPGDERFYRGYGIDRSRQSGICRC